MNTNLRVKLILLIIPILLLVYVFLIRDRLSAAGIGGGSYDLTKMFTLIGVGVYMFVYNVVLLMVGGRLNGWFLLVGMVTLIIVAVMAARSF